MQDAPDGPNPDFDENDHALSRRIVLGGTVGLACAAASCLAPLGAFAQQKTKQADAKYQTTPKGASKCGVCMQFQAPSSCKLVEGTISPEGWCMLFTPKAHG